MWRGPVGLGAMRTRGLPVTAASGIRGLSRDPVEEGRIGGAVEDADQRRGPQAERRAPERAVERERVQGLGAGEDGYWRARPQAARLEVRQEPGVLLGLLGDPVDRDLRSGRS